MIAHSGTMQDCAAEMHAVKTGERAQTPVPPLIWRLEKTSLHLYAEDNSRDLDFSMRLAWRRISRQALKLDIDGMRS